MDSDRFEITAVTITLSQIFDMTPASPPLRHRISKTLSQSGSHRQPSWSCMCDR